MASVVQRLRASWLAGLILLPAALSLSAQTVTPPRPSTPASAPAPRPAQSKKYCHPSAEFCFRYPASWTMLGEVFGGNGVVVAPEQKGDRALWDAITAALVAPGSDDTAAAGKSEAAGNEPDASAPLTSLKGVTLNGLIDRAAAAMREAGQNFETLQRRELTVAGNPAQMLKVRYRENATEHDWIEELVFIQGSEGEIYSVALKCAPEHFAHLEPALKQVLASWAVPAPE